jgi:hypothetical protein
LKVYAELLIPQNVEPLYCFICVVVFIGVVFIMDDFLNDIPRYGWIKGSENIIFQL